jgi:hypothetical protein
MMATIDNRRGQATCLKLPLVDVSANAAPFEQSENSRHNVL